MKIDNITYRDLSIFHSDEEFSVFNKLNFTRTAEGKEWLLRFFQNPFNDPLLIGETQSIIKLVLQKMPEWPESISNGTIMVIAKFYDTAIDAIPTDNNLLNAYEYKIFHNPDYSLLKYSLTHFADFLRGIHQLIHFFDNDETPETLRSYILRAKDLLGRNITGELSTRPKEKTFSPRETIYYGRYLRYHFKNALFELIDIFGRIDAWYSMAAAMKHYQLTFPRFTAMESSATDDYKPYLDAQALYHILLPEPVPYDVRMNARSNFIFLTGANMAGKSTFIRSVGCAVFLAHLGMGVPAKQMTLSIFDGLLSNINVADNIFKGESYFFNEVQRIKNTIIKINDKRKWLVLIDELFKGTNMQDAMKCSSVVIKGLIKISNSLFILSTHLYEIGEELKEYPTISFKYFETTVVDDQLKFSYQLKEGISNDRLGYVILKREKVVELLDKL